MTELKKEKEGKKLWYGDKESEKYEKYLHQHTELRYFNN